MNDTETRLCDLLRAALDQPFPDMTETSDLVDELALESIQVMDFIAEVEDDFDILIEVDQLASVRTIAQLAVLVREQAA